MGKFDRGGHKFAGGRKFTEMHKATCSECGKLCTLPFRPSGDRPVFCSFCFDKQGGGDRSNRFGGGHHRERSERPRFEDRQMHDAVCSKCGADCQVPFRPTGDKEVFCDTCFSGTKKDFAPKKSKDSGETLAQLKMLNEKIDKLLEILAPVKIKKTEKPFDLAQDLREEKKATKAKKASKKALVKKKK